MATEIGKLYYDLEIDDSKLGSGLGSADKKVTEFGEKMSQGFKVAAAGIAVVGAGLALYAKNATEFTVDLVKSSKVLGREIGVSTEEASRLVAAMGRVGVTTEEASSMFGIFSKKIVEATKDTVGSSSEMQKLRLQIEKTKKEISNTSAEIKKSGDKSGELDLKLRTLNNTLAIQQAEASKSANVFQQLGVSTLDAQGKQKDFNTILFEVADKFKSLPDGIDKTAASMELFGRSGKDMIKVLNLGSDGIKDLEEQADKLGLTLTADTIGKVSDLVQSQKELKTQTDALKIAVGTNTAPVLTKFNETINKMVGRLLESEGPMKTITTLMLAFGGGAFSAVSSIAALGASLVGMGISLVTLGWIALAILAIAAAAYVVYTNWDTIKQWFNNFMQWLKDNWQLVLGILFAPFGLALYLITTHFETLKTFFLGVIQWFRDNWPLVLAILTGPFGLAILAIIKNWDTIKAFFTGAIQWFKDIGKKIGDGIAGGISGAVEAVKGTIKAALNWIIDKANTAIKGVNKVSPPGVPEIGEIPKFKNGVENFAGGLAFVHKNEALVNLSPGTSVIKASEADKIGSGARINISIGNINNQQDADYLIQRINRNYELAGFGISPVGN